MNTTTHIADVLKALQEKVLKGEAIDLQGLVDSLDHDKNLDPVRKLIIQHTDYTKRDWGAAVHRAKVKAALGAFPNTANELLRIVVGSERIRVAFNRSITKGSLPTFEGSVINPEDRARDRLIDNVARIRESREVNTETLKRELRQINEEHRLGFSKDAISDAVTTWFLDAIEDRKLELFGDIAFAPQSPDVVAANWQRIAGAFCPEEHDADFVRAVLSKFVWQVKRKMLGLPITDHLMPVLLGPQGVGKSTLIRDIFLKPLEEVTMNTDFSEITDNRNHDMWRFFVLFMDEMSHAGKADMDTVKNLITLPMLQRRPMGSNDVVNIRQNATFIGCSNREIEQLIRDETGNRRFAALRFSSVPDHAAINAIDAQVLWQSVDEYADDPMQPFKSVLKAKQAAWRERSQVEQWLDQHDVPTSREGVNQPAAELYKDYSQWADTYFRGQVWTYNVWGKEFKRVINNNPDLGWRATRSNKGSGYTYAK
ncbi:VapE domain-containing protein [Methylobacterium fujisawaense]|uniref:VapE domain-containing protein n=1 Tax=Methylobacterium fujisawaense TaxID=107400 RepID=UPI003CECBC11